MIIIGITGTLGSGKGEVVKYLREKYNFKHYSASGFITEEIIRRGLPVNRESMSVVGDDLRARHHSGFIIEELYKKAVASGENSIIESIHAPGEIDTLREKGKAILFAVDADPKLRYERILLRKSAKDNVSLEQFLEIEKKEMESLDPNKHNLAACIKRADFLFMNDGSLVDLHTQVDDVMKTLSIK